MAQTSIPAFAHLLRQWRGSRRMSQLALATEAGISARHLSFLETGRAQPSREMVQLLCNMLDIPLSERNSLLVAAGYAPLFSESSLEAPEFERVRHALQFVLRQQEPYPAIVLDSCWNIWMRNAAANRVFGPFNEGSTLTPAQSRNMLHVLCHPGGVRRFMINWEECVTPLIQSLYREAASGTNPGAARLRDEVLAYPGMPSGWKLSDAAAPALPLLAMRVRKDDLELAFFTTITTFTEPRDVTLQQLRIECSYPADAATEEVVRRLAAGTTVPG